MYTQDTFSWPNGVHNREVPLHVYMYVHVRIGLTRVVGIGCGGGFDAREVQVH